MKKNSVFVLIIVMLLALLAAGCDLPGVQQGAGAAEAASAAADIRTAGGAQHPTVYEVRVSKTDAVYSQYPSIAWTGTGKEYGIAWANTGDPRDSQSDIMFARVNKNGAKTGGDMMISNDGDHYATRPSLAWSGSEYGVAWEDNRDVNTEIYFAHLDASGNKIGGDVKISQKKVSAGSYKPSLVWGGGHYGVAWEDYRDTLSNIYFAVLNPDGQKIYGEYKISKNSGTCYSTAPSLAWTGSGYGLAWNDHRDGRGEIHFALLDMKGGKITEETKLLESDADFYSPPSLVSTGNGYGLAWWDDGENRHGIYFANISAKGAKSNDVKIASIGENTIDPTVSLAWTGSGYGLVWGNGNNGIITDLYFVRISAGGEKQGSGLMIPTDDDYASANPSLVWAKESNEYGVAWQDGRAGYSRIYFARTDGAGTLLPQGGLTGTLKGTQPGYYYIRNCQYGTYLTWGGEGVVLKEYDQFWPASQQWRLVDENADGSFQLFNCGSASNVSPSLAGQYSGGSLSQILTLFWGQPTDADKLKSWWLYYDDNHDMYLIRILEDVSYRVYATTDHTVKLKESSRNFYKHWELIPAGD
jgi:hypothetical protein